MKTFAEVHQAGAQKFGVVWLLATQEARDALRFAGIDVAHNEKLKYAISLATYKILVSTYTPLLQRANNQIVGKEKR